MLKRKLQFWGTVYPRYIRKVDQLNRNAEVLQWYKSISDVHKSRDRDEYFEYIATEYVKNEPIDYLEFGVYKGESIQKWASLNTHPESRFYGFDSFEGLPEGWYGGWRPGAFDVGGKQPDSNDKRIEYVKGWFQDTLRDFLKSYKPKNRLVIHNDSDLYSSTLYVLTMLDELIEKDTILMFDELWALFTSGGPGTTTWVPTIVRPSLSRKPTTKRRASALSFYRQ